MLVLAGVVSQLVEWRDCAPPYPTRLVALSQPNASNAAIGFA